MQNTILLATTLLSGCIFAMPLSQDFTCPEDDCRISQCLYPNLNNCSTFWQCSDEGRAFLRICPGGLEFNDYIHVCDWPSANTCRYAPRPTTPAPTTTEESVETSTEARPTEGAPVQSSTAAPSETSTEIRPTEGAPVQSSAAPAETTTENNQETTTEPEQETTTRQPDQETTTVQDENSTETPSNLIGNIAM